jgi:hypothetical protein
LTNRIARDHLASAKSPENGRFGDGTTPANPCGVTSLERLLLALVVALVACGPAGESVGSSDEDLGVGVYMSKATSYANSGYIGDWEHDWGYVLGYLRPGARIYAKTVRADSVYGLIVNSHYGAWDHGHHCGWVSLKHLKGHGFHSSAGDICPSPDNDFSLAKGSGGPTGFRKGSWIECDGCVQPAIVLPTCSDFTVYANYDPATHTFHDPDGTEVAGRGTIYGSDHYAGATEGYSGFGTRFVTSDEVAVEIKDTRRQCGLKGGCTAFGFMHADCIGGKLVGTPAGKGATPPPAQPTQCGQATPGEGIERGRSVASCNQRYVMSLQTDGNLVLRDTQKNNAAIWATNTSNTDGAAALFQTDGNLVLYGTNQDALWSSHTNGKGGVLLAFQDDGNVVLYDQAMHPVWQTGTAGQ